MPVTGVRVDVSRVQLAIWIYVGFVSPLNAKIQRTISQLAGRQGQGMLVGRNEEQGRIGRTRAL